MVGTVTGDTRALPGTSGEEGLLPETIFEAVQLEFGTLHTWCLPWWPSTVSSIAGLWWWAPGPWKDALFSLHGPLAFALVLGGWMIEV